MSRELDPLVNARLDGAAAFDAARAIIFVEPGEYIDLSGHQARLYWSPQLALRNRGDQAVALIDNPWSAVVLNANEATLLSDLSNFTLRALSQANPSCAWVVTNGPDPTEVYLNGHRHLFAVAPTTARSPVGCGDAFAAGFFFGHYSGWSLLEAVEFGQRLAQLVLGQIGCQLDRTSVSSELRRLVDERVPQSGPSGRSAPGT